MHLWLTKLTFAFFLSLVSMRVAVAQIEDFAKVNFQKADSFARLYPHHPLADIKVLAEKLTKSLTTDVEKFRAVYLWVCINIENDYDLFQKAKRTRQSLKSAEELSRWNKKFGTLVIETLIKKQRTVCTGYAFLVRELALYAGLSCMIVNGYGRTAQVNIDGVILPNHSWNAVRLNNKWYLCDATWSSGVIDAETKTFVNKYNDSYFLLDPSLFVLNHFPLDTAWMLLLKKPTLKEFLGRPLIYKDMFQYQIEHFHPETFNIATEKGKEVSFQFRQISEKDIKKVELQLVSSHNSNLASPAFSQNTNTISFKYNFSIRGTYIVHILLDEKYALSYKVNVK